MRAEGGAEESVIAQQFLAARRQWQADRALFDGGPFGEQRQLRLDAGDGPARLVPVSGETAQGAGIGQQLQGPGVEPGASAEIVHVEERLGLPDLLDTPGILLAKASDHPQAKAYGRLRLAKRLQAAIPTAVADIHRACLQGVTAGVLEQLVGAVEAHRPTVDQGAGEGRRLVTFQPTAGVGEQGEAGGVGFRETVAAEAFDLLEDARCEVGLVALGEHARVSRSRWCSRPP